MNGVKYKPNMVIVNDFAESGEPIFCVINDIGINNKNDRTVLFTCKLLKIVKFNAHLRAYNVTILPETNKISIDKCKSQPSILRSINNELYVSLTKM